jgi:hypothetical protein
MPEEVSFSKSFHRYDETPEINYNRRSTPRYSEKLEFEAITPEVHKHNERKNRLGLGINVKPDAFVRRSTDFKRVEPENSCSRSSQRKISRPRSPLRSFVTKSPPYRSKSRRSGENAKSTYTPISEGVSYFRSSIYDRSKKVQGGTQDVKRRASQESNRRPQSAGKGLLKKAIKPRVPSERTKRDIRKYNVEEMAKSRLTIASRDGRSTMKSTGIKYLSPKQKNDIGYYNFAGHGASRGCMTTTSKQARKILKKKKPKIVKKTIKKKTTKTTKMKRVKSVPKTNKIIVLCPAKSIVIYDYDKTGNEIIKQETVHEYKERMVLEKDIGRKTNVAAKRIGENWDQSKCRKNMELEKIVDKAWHNIGPHGQFKRNMKKRRVQEF